MPLMFGMQPPLGDKNLCKTCLFGVSEHSHLYFSIIAGQSSLKNSVDSFDFWQDFSVGLDLESGRQGASQGLEKLPWAG